MDYNNRYNKFQSFEFNFERLIVGSATKMIYCEKIVKLEEISMLEIADTCETGFLCFCARIINEIQKQQGN